MSMFDTFYSDMQRRGLMLVLSSPSGAGKTSIAAACSKTKIS